MKKNSLNLRSLVEKYQKNCDRINEIADACEKEQRERNEAEEAEFKAIARENQLLEMRMRASAESYEGEAKVDAAKILRENMLAGRQTKIMLTRSVMVVSDMANGGLVPLKINDLVDPLEEGLIYKQLGLPFATGLAGDFNWPLYEFVDATLVGEGVALGDTKIPLDKISPAPERMGIAIPVSRESINQTEGVIENIVRKVLPHAIDRLINKILLGIEKVNGSTNLAGPFVKAALNPVALSSEPTFKELNAMKADVLSAGTDGSALCWTMSKAQEAILEGLPINSDGIFRPIAENHRMCGLPIFTSDTCRKVVVAGYKYDGTDSEWDAYTIQSGDTIKYKETGDSAAHALAKISSPSDGEIAQVTVITEYIGLGDWRYQPSGLFGALNFVVDPYSQARKNAVDFVLNTDFATKTLHEEAFKVGKVAVKADS